MDGKLNPGSDEAIKKGCKCPVLDNGHGRGAFVDEEGNPVFWYNMDCPIHGGAEAIHPESILYREN